MQSVLFDLDGTLTDSGEGIMNCARLALEHFKLPLPTEQELRTFVGPPLRDSFLRFGVPEDRVEEAVSVFRSRYHAVGIFENHPYPGISSLLETLCRRGFRLYVATSKPESMALRVLEHFSMLSYFDTVCGATMDGSRSTKSQVLSCLLEQIGKTDDLVMVGDTEFDVLGAKEHGIPTIGVTWGYGSELSIRQAGAAAVAHTPEQLADLLQKPLSAL